MTKVLLGQAEFEVIDQPHAYLLHELSEVLGRVLEAGGSLDGDDLIRSLGDGVYDVLAVFLPDLSKRIPKHEFAGYASVSAQEAGEYDAEFARRTPTIPQIAGALDAAVEVNGREYFAKLFGFVDPKLVRAVVTERMAGSLSMRSASSPRTSGESAPMSSGDAAPPQAQMIVESPSPA